MKLIKRNGAEEIFDRNKIYLAVEKANGAVDDVDRIKPNQIEKITDRVTKKMREARPRGMRGGDTGYGGEGDYGSRCVHLSQNLYHLQIHS